MRTGIISLRPSFRCNSSLPFVTYFLSFQLFFFPFVTSSPSFQLFPSVPYTACLSLQLFFSVRYFLPIVSTLPSCSFKSLVSGGKICLRGAICLRGIRLRNSSHNVKFHWSVLKPNLPFSSQSLYIKSMVFRNFWCLSGGGRSRFYKKLCTRVLLQNAVHDKSQPEIKLGHHASNLCFVGERNSEHDFFQLKWKLD